jgi:hypothetical protein
MAVSDAARGPHPCAVQGCRSVAEGRDARERQGHGLKHNPHNPLGLVVCFKFLGQQWVRAYRPGIMRDPVLTAVWLIADGPGPAVVERVHSFAPVEPETS